MIEEIYVLDDAGDPIGFYLTEEAANSAFDASSDEEKPRRLVYRVELSFPLDPEPWVNYSSGERAVSPPEAPSKHGWYWHPRMGFLQASEAYSDRGGLDPYPWRTPFPPGKVVKGRIRWQAEYEGYARTPNVFDPREGFEQDRSKYA